MHLKQGVLLQGGKYKIVRHISSGGFGNTYEGIHTMMDTRVAIKEFFPKMFCNRDENTSHITVASQSNRDLVEKLREKFTEEAKAIFKMNHPNIVKVHDIFEENGTAYYVMDYIEGESLSEIVKQRVALSEAEALGYICQVTEALKYVHSLNRLHLDIKPGNIMIDKNGIAILIDFGASKHYDMESGENTSTLMGVNTKGYAPVEQSTQSFTKFSPATDIYALGATLYKLLTGITPPDAQMLLAKEETLSPMPASLSTSTRNAVLKAMTLIRADRPQTIEAFLALLDSNTVDISDDESTVCEEGEKTCQTEETCKAAEEETCRKTEEERRKKDDEKKGRKALQESRSKKALLWGLVGVIAVACIIIGVNSKGDSSAPPWYFAENEGTTQSRNNASYSDGVLSIDGVTYDMVKVQAGIFSMGTSEIFKAEGFAKDVVIDLFVKEKPTHQVTITNDYYIGRTEVTQALWKVIMGNNPSEFNGNNRPVENVSWDDCQLFISRINAMTGQTFRLPTEAEWEFAARGGNYSRHYRYSGGNKLDTVAWYSENSLDRTNPVATKQPNELGIYDMCGNVSEWCSDWYGDYSGSSQIDPIGPSNGSMRVIRGGHWWDYERKCTLWSRYSSTPQYGYKSLGFRLAL